MGVVIASLCFWTIPTTHTQRKHSFLDHPALSLLTHTSAGQYLPNLNTGFYVSFVTVQQKEFARGLPITHTVKSKNLQGMITDFSGKQQEIGACPPRFPSSWILPVLKQCIPLT